MSEAASSFAKQIKAHIKTSIITALVVTVLIALVIFLAITHPEAFSNAPQNSGGNFKILANSSRWGIELMKQHPNVAAGIGLGAMAMAIISYGNYKYFSYKEVDLAAMLDSGEVDLEALLDPNGPYCIS